MHAALTVPLLAQSEFANSGKSIALVGNWITLSLDLSGMGVGNHSTSDHASGHSLALAQFADGDQIATFLKLDIAPPENRPPASSAS